MSDYFSEELYHERKHFWLKKFAELAATVDKTSVEDQDAFYNAMEDLFFS